MANTIRIKRSTGSSAPTTLQNAELAYSEGVSGGGTLFIGVGTGGAGGSATSVIAIGGPSVYASKSYVDSAVAAVDVSSQLANYLPLTGGTISSNLTVTGNLTVNGTTTTISSTTLAVADKNIELAKVTNPTDTTADGAGITVKGSTDHTWNWVDATDAWTSSEHIDVASGKAYYINGTSVLSSSTLGSGVTASSLTSVGTISSGTWQGTAVAVAHGGTGATTLTGLVKGNGTSAFSAAVAGTDYLDPNSTLDGGTY
jgi:hypothetical protein